MCSIDFKQKRINYLNNWPNVEPFEIEKQYDAMVKEVKKENNTIFIPFTMRREDDANYNKAISFIIDAIEELERYPNYSFEFMFKAYDVFSKNIFAQNITERSKWLCENKWSSFIESNSKLCEAVKGILECIPMKACQYIYTRIYDRNSKAYKRVTTEFGGSIENEKRKNMITSIESKYGYDYHSYNQTIRPASALYRFMLRKDEIDVNGTKFSISMSDKLHFIMSGYLYTLRNDTMHGNDISITKSSKTNISTYATNYYAR